MPDILILARWSVPEDQVEHVLALLELHAAATRAEPGCRQFFAAQDSDDPCQLVLMERYADRSAFEAHLSSAHYRDYVADGIRPLLGERVIHHLVEVARL